MRPARLAVVALLLALPSAVQAQVRNHLYDKWQLSGSGTLMMYGTNIRFDPADGGEGTEIDAEQDLGLEDSNFEPRLAVRLRMGKRHELEAGFQWADRAAENVLTRDITIRDSVFQAGLRIETEFNTSQAFLTYRWAFTAKENTQIGLGVGLGAIFISEQIAAVAGATGGGPDTAIVRREQERSQPGPTMSVGLFGRFRLGERWYIEADARGVYLAVSNVEATIIEGGAALRYFFSNSLGAELGVSAGFYELTIDRDGRLIDLSGNIKYDAVGVRAGIVFTP